MRLLGQAAHGETRERVLHNHLAYLEAHEDIMRSGSPMLDEDDTMVGTLLVIDFENAAAAHVPVDSEVFNLDVYKGVPHGIPLTHRNQLARDPVTFPSA